MLMMMHAFFACRRRCDDTGASLVVAIDIGRGLLAALSRRCKTQAILGRRLVAVAFAMSGGAQVLDVLRRGIHTSVYVFFGCGGEDARIEREERITKTKHYYCTSVE